MTIIYNLIISGLVRVYHTLNDLSREKVDNMHIIKNYLTAIFSDICTYTPVNNSCLINNWVANA